MEDWTKNGLSKLNCLPINGLDDRSIILGVIFTLSSLIVALVSKTISSFIGIIFVLLCFRYKNRVGNYIAKSKLKNRGNTEGKHVEPPWETIGNS